MPCNIPCSMLFRAHHDAASTCYMWPAPILTSNPCISGNPMPAMMSLLLLHPRSAYPTFGSLADHFYLQYCFNDLEANSDVVSCHSPSAYVGSFHSSDILSHVHTVP